MRLSSVRQSAFLPLVPQKRQGRAVVKILGIRRQWLPVRAS